MQLLPTLAGQLLAVVCFALASPARAQTIDHGWDPIKSCGAGMPRMFGDGKAVDLAGVREPLWAGADGVAFANAPTGS